MTSKTYDSGDTPKTEKLIPDHIAALLGEPPVQTFESKEEYDALFSAMVAHFEPRDLIDFFAVRDIADLMWMIRGLKSMRKAQMELNLPAAASQLMGKEIESHYKAGNYLAETIITPVIRKAVNGETKSQKLFNSIAAAAGVNNESLMVTAYSMGLDTITKIEEAISKKELRCDGLMRGFEQRAKMRAAMLPKWDEVKSSIVEVSVGDDNHMSKE